ncbi:MAG TPA: hypothetical protein VFE45_07505, partial [Coriobacteriia bacterium]|nr:hypothetical protein [Coriobacteriia bacterium]
MPAFRDAQYQNLDRTVAADLERYSTSAERLFSANFKYPSGLWSDEGTCSGTTLTLATPVISIWGVTTRGANTSASCTNGSSCTSSIAGGAASRSDLRDGTWHGVSANNTDGYNNVGSSSGFTTLWLATPAYPTCGAS